MSVRDTETNGHKLQLPVLTSLAFTSSNSTQYVEHVRLVTYNYQHCMSVLSSLVLNKEKKSCTPVLVLQYCTAIHQTNFVLHAVACSEYRYCSVLQQPVYGSQGELS